MVTSIDVYNLLEYIYPDASIHQLSKILRSKKSELKNLLGLPSFQRTPLGFYCQDLAEYRGRLYIIVGMGEPRKCFLKREISKKLDSDSFKQLCDIFNLKLENIL